MDWEALELFAYGAGGRAQAAVGAPHLATQLVQDQDICRFSKAAVGAPHLATQLVQD
jgi:hypothetical protein